MTESTDTEETYGRIRDEELKYEDTVLIGVSSLVPRDKLSIDTGEPISHNKRADMFFRGNLDPQFKERKPPYFPCVDQGCWEPTEEDREFVRSRRERSNVYWTPEEFNAFPNVKSLIMSGDLTGILENEATDADIGRSELYKGLEYKTGERHDPSILVGFGEYINVIDMISSWCGLMRKRTDRVVRDHLLTGKNYEYTLKEILTLSHMGQLVRHSDPSHHQDGLRRLYLVRKASDEFINNTWNLPHHTDTPVEQIKKEVKDLREKLLSGDPHS